nr:SDR family NAD(P)-dependent oxidoreductase [uncultured Parabacteroides sp.]
MANTYIILVTGASSGFGQITATLLAKQGYTVYGTSRKETDNTPEGIRMIRNHQHQFHRRHHSRSFSRFLFGFQICSRRI